MIVLNMVRALIDLVSLRFLICYATLSQLFTEWLQINSTGITIITILLIVNMILKRSYS